jgi:hypothetical protein
MTGYLNYHTTTGGGVVIAVSNLLQSVMQIHDLEATKERVWIEMPVSDNFNLLLGNHYFVPDSNFTDIDNYLKFKCISVSRKHVKLF